MTMNDNTLLGKDLTKISDLSPAGVEMILERALSFKRKHSEGVRRENILDGRVVAMIFEKPSLRTKVAFEVATHYLGGIPIFLSSSQILASGNDQRGRESVPDIARNLERFSDVIVARVYEHEVIQEICEASTKPVINALCNRHHPTQALADLLALRLHTPSPAERIKVAYIGDGNNVATSLMQICTMMGIDFAIATPEGYEVNSAEQQIAHSYATRNKSYLRGFHDPVKAVKDADVVYTDTFVSMGQEDERDVRHRQFARFQVNSQLMAHAKPSALFMHCLPAHRGEEVTDEIMDHSTSIVFDQSECRLHIAKALLSIYLT